MTIKPHPMYEVIRADEVAETFPDVPRELYAKLWNDIVPLQKSIPNIEDSGPADHVGHENLASHWERLTSEEQRMLNDIAESLDREYEASQKEFKL